MNLTFAFEHEEEHLTRAEGAEESLADGASWIPGVVRRGVHGAVHTSSTAVA